MQADDASKYAFLIGGVCDALGQVLDRHLPPDYNYHNLPAPWLTISLLRLLRPLIAACVGCVCYSHIFLFLLFVTSVNVIKRVVDLLMVFFPFFHISCSL